MEKILVRLSAEPTRTRMLMTHGTRDIGKAVLPPVSAHPRATATLLEGLSLFVGERLCVVLCVDDRSSSSASLGLLDALGCSERSVFYDVGIATRLCRRDRRRAAEAVHLEGGGDFRDLRQLGWGWV
jgi:hypothetical protein